MTWLSIVQANAVADKCIDRILITVLSSLCHTDFENAPWLALEFFEPVNVTRVVIYNRGDSDHYYQRLKNVEVRVTDKLPTSGEKMFTEGELLGTFAGPGGRGQIITIDGNFNVTGKYVLVQMNNTDFLNLHEVEVFGPPPILETECKPLKVVTDEVFFTNEEGLVENVLAQDGREVEGAGEHNSGSRVHAEGNRQKYNRGNNPKRRPTMGLQRLQGIRSS